MIFPLLALSPQIPLLPYVVGGRLREPFPPNIVNKQTISATISIYQTNLGICLPSIHPIPFSLFSVYFMK